MGRLISRIAAFAGVLAIGVLAVPAGAQSVDCVGVEVQPSRAAHDLDVEHSYGVRVRNCSDETFEVSVSIAKLGHDLDGAPQFYESTKVERAVTLDPAAGTFTLKPGKARSFDVTAAIPRGDRSLYAGIVAEFRRPGAATGSSVAARSRVAGMLLMRGPKPWEESAAVVDVGLTPRADGSYSVYAAVEDTGNVHINPTGSMEIRKDGTLLDTVKLDGGTILPGFKRRLTGSWTPPKELDGKVRLTARIGNPPARGSATIDFTDGETAAPAASITSLIASEVEGLPYVAVTLQNTGSIELRPSIEIAIREGEIGRMLQHFPFTEPLAPGASRTIEWQPALGDGTFEIVARATQDGTLLDERVTGLRIGAPSVAEGAGGSRWTILILAAVLLIIVLGLLLFVVARRRRDDDAPPPSSPAPPRGWVDRPETEAHPVTVGATRAVGADAQRDPRTGTDSIAAWTPTGTSWPWRWQRRARRSSTTMCRSGA